MHANAHVVGVRLSARVVDVLQRDRRRAPVELLLYRWRLRLRQLVELLVDRRGRVRHEEQGGRAGKRASEADATNESATSLRSSLAARAYRLRFFPKCGRQKRLPQKILLLRLAAAGYGGAGFQLLHEFL